MNFAPMRNTFICLILICLGALARADVVPAFLFNDNAVLQRDKPISVWGSADPGEEVTVTFAGKTVATSADATGKWRVDLPALPANSKRAEDNSTAHFTRCGTVYPFRKPA